MGQLMLTPIQLDNLTPREFFYKLNGFYELQQLKIRTTWETSRLTAALVINSFAEQSISPADLIRFSWEKQKELPTTDKDLFNRRVAEFQKHN